MPHVRARDVKVALAALVLGAGLALAQEPPAAPAAAPTPAPTPAATPRPRPRPTPQPSPDVYHLRNGDRITGRTLSKGRNSFAVQTPFGRLTLPRGQVEKVVHPDGKEDVVTPVEVAGPPLPDAPVPVPAPREGAARLAVAITGKTFWQAWDRREAGRDPSLRLELRLDEEAVVVYVDGQPDPDELPGSIVNAFSFAAGLTTAPAPGIHVHPAEVRPGRIVLKLDLPTPSATTKRLRLAYQLNTGTAEEPAWKDVVSAATEVALDPAQPALVEVRQERGKMEYAGFPRRRMRHVDTFTLDLAARREAATPDAP